MATTRNKNGYKKLVRFPDAPEGKVKREEKVKDYTRFQISIHSYKNEPKDLSKVRWSKTVYNTGSRKMKSLIKDGLVSSNDFPHYSVKNGKVYYNTAFTKTYGLKQFADLQKLNANNDDKISFQVSFYLPKSDAILIKKFKNDPYNNRYLISRGGVEMVPLFHAKYYITCPYKTIYDFLQTYCKTNKTFFVVKNNENAYDAFWNDLVNKVDIDVNGPNAEKNINKVVFQSVKDYLTINFSNFVKNKDDVEALSYRNGVARNDVWFNSKDRVDNEKKKGICKFYADDEYSTYPRNGCLFIIMYFYFCDVMERLSKQKDGRGKKYEGFCISRIYKIIYGKNAVVPLPDDGGAWGLTFDQVKKFLKYFHIRGGVFDGFYGDLKCYYEPEEDGYKNDRHLPDFYYIYANNHAWPIDKKLIKNLGQDELKKIRKQKGEELDEIAQKLNADVKKNYESEFVNYPFFNKKKNKDETKEDIYVFFGSFDEIFSFLNSCLEQGNYYVLTNLDLKDEVFIPFLDKKIIPSVCIKYQRIDKLFLGGWEGNKNITIKNQYSSSAGQTFLNNIDEYKSYFTYFEKVKNSLVSPKYLSVYSPQVKSLFHSYKVGGLRCVFDWNSYEEPLKISGNEEISLDDDYEYGISDFNRFFLSEFIKIKYFPVLNFDDNFVDYDSSPLEDYTIYLVEKTTETFEYPFYHDCFCFGSKLKMIDSGRFVIKKMLRPSQLMENIFVDDFRKIYNDKKLGDAFKKDIPNIIFGFLVQKFKTEHRSYFSTDLQEIRHFQQKIGGHSFSLENDRGHFFYKKFSSPLNSGFYPIGLMLLDSVHFTMGKLVEDLRSCDLHPFAINVDCIYHERNAEKYELFKQKFPHYFNYQDKNAWEAVGKLKYEEKHVHFSKEYIPKRFVLDFSISSINNIDLKHEEQWNQGDMFVEEIASLIEKHDRLFFFGHAGMGKSTSAILGCMKLGLSFLILTKTTKLSDKWIFDKYSAQTVDSFFGFRSLELLPTSGMCKNAFDNADVIIFDDMLLYELKLVHQVFFLMDRCPNKKYVGNACPLQLHSVLNTLNVFDANKYEKLVGLCSRLFGNVVQLKVNKRLKSEEHRNEFYKMIDFFKQKNTDAINAWIIKNCNVIKKGDLYSLRNHIKVVITATNNQRTMYNNLLFPVVYGNDDWFSVGHTIMFDKPSIKAFGYKFGKSQLFRINERDGDAFVLENIYTGDIVVVETVDWVRKNFNYPFATTCHSWQGDTCKEKIIIDGWSRNWVDLEWKFSAITRPDDFKNVYVILNDENVPTIHNDKKLQEKLDSLIEQDINRFGKDCINFSRMIDLDWMKYKIHEAVMEKRLCPGCGGDINSWDRIDSSLPHYKSNTQLTCFDCNRSKSDRW